MNKSIEQLHNELVTDTAHQRALLHSRPNNDPNELEEICNLWANPITAHEQHTYRADFIGDDIDFERYIVGTRRIGYFARQLEASRAVLGGTNE